MYGRLCANLGVVMAIVFALMVIAFSQQVTAQTTCPNPGEHPATAADVPLMLQAGIPNAAVGVCWNPNSPAIGADVGQAKTYLNSVPKKPLSSCAPPNQQNIEKLNDTFAVCAAQFIQAYTQKYGQLYITSAFRDGNPGTAGNGSGQSANQCAGGAPNSNHTRGLAMDVYPSSGNFKTLWNFAIQNPQFGVCFPHEGQNGGLLDRPHMILAGIGGVEGSECAALGVTKPCSGAPVLNVQPAAPTYNNTEGTGEQGSQAIIGAGSAIPAGYCLVSSQPVIYMPCGTTLPQSQLTPAPIAQPLQAPTPVATTPTVTPTVTSSTSACTPQYYCSNGTVYYQSNSCSTSVFQACKYGCLGTTCALATSTSLVTGNPLSPTDILQQLITLNPATTSTTSSSLNSGIYNILQGIFSPQSQTPSQTQVVQNPTYPVDTFTTGNFSSNTFGTQSYTPFQQLLTSLKSALLGLLSFFQPSTQ